MSLSLSLDAALPSRAAATPIAAKFMGSPRSVSRAGTLGGASSNEKPRESVNRSNPVAPFKDSRSLEESRYKDAKDDPPIKPRTGNAFINMSKKLLNNMSSQGETLNPGLVNLGNSCYFNSTLQGLISTSLLENMTRFSVPGDVSSRVAPQRSPALTNGRGGEFEFEYTTGMDICMAFIRTMERAWELRDTRKRTAMSGRELLHRIGVKYDQYLDFRQQDGHELLRHLLDGMYMEEQDIIRKRQPPPPKGPKRKRGASTRISPLQSRTEVLTPIKESERLVPFVDQVFGGKLASMLVCGSCKHVSHTFEDFMDLSLSIRSEDDKDSKRNRLKAFAQRFRRQAGLAIPRPLSTPPSPRLQPTDPSPVPARRKSFEGAESRQDSDVEEITPKDSSSKPTSSAGESFATLGRRVSVQLKLRISTDKSSSKADEETSGGSDKPLPSAPSNARQKKQKDKNKQAYLAQILADSSTKPNPLALLKSASVAPNNSQGENSSGSSSWLKFNPQGPNLIDCLRQFTTVEALDGENMVGCSRCWKTANPDYEVLSEESESESSSSSSESSSESEDSPPSRAGSIRAVPPTKRRSAQIGSTEPSESTASNGYSITSHSEASSSVASTSTLPSSVAASLETESSSSQGNGLYGGHPIPSISTTSPAEPSSVLPGVSRSGRESRVQSTTASGNSLYLTPSSSPRGSLKRLNSSASSGGEESEGGISAANASELSLSPSANKRKGKLKVARPRIPKSQRVMLRRAYKRYLIAVPPPVLVVHLKRFQQVTKSPVALFGNLKKLDEFVAFPEYLDLKPFIAPRREEYGRRPAKIIDTKGAYDPQVIYRLYAVVVHIGNMLGGHYIAYVALPPSGSAAGENGKPPVRKWQYISDQIVRITNLEEVLTAKAYLCFYERIYDPIVLAAVEATTGNQQQRRK